MILIEKKYADRYIAVIPEIELALDGETDQAIYVEILNIILPCEGGFCQF